jgi:hypothetical protein
MTDVFLVSLALSVVSSNMRSTWQTARPSLLLVSGDLDLTLRFLMNFDYRSSTMSYDWSEQA